MDADLKKLKKFAKAMRNAGILTYKTTDFELSLSPSAVFKEENDALPATPTTNEIDTDALSPEDVLLWSAGASHEEAI